MKTKLLLLALVSIGAGPLMAQQTNYTVTLPPGYKIIANHLVNSNTIPQLFPNVPDGTKILKWAGNGFMQNQYDAELGEWFDPSQTLSPGEGAFFFNPTATNMSVTFSGTILPGPVTNMVPHGYSLLGSKRLQPALPGAFIHCAGAKIQKWIQVPPIGAYATSTYDPDFGWDVEPNIAVGEGFFVFNPCGAFAWAQN